MRARLDGGAPQEVAARRSQRIASMGSASMREIFHSFATSSIDTNPPPLCSLAD